MAKQRIEIDVDVPEGFEVLRFVPPRKGEIFLTCDGVSVITADRDYTEPRLILRRVEPVRESRWRNVYPKDHSTYAYYYKSYEEARSCMSDIAKAEGGRIERVDFENGTPVNVALESQRRARDED